uniref:Uncharacterized protein n=1 Tax=Brassica oleracea TaxID=3712 RepID=A0A3P6F3Q9_BRAOL|nr:unnamed protein product [Brassica oleracea]
MLTERQTSYEEEVTFDQDIASMLSKKLFGSFPLNPGNNISQKSDESNFVLNGVLTEIFFGSKWMEPPSLDNLMQKTQKYIFLKQIFFLKIVRDLIIPNGDILYFNDPILSSYQRSWPNKLPPLLNQLGLVPPIVKILIPLVPPSNPALAIDNFSSPLLRAVALCCLYDQLEPDVLDRIVKVLHDSYKDGYIPITDHFSFFITLIARFRVVRGDLAIESNEGRDTTFKALTDCVLIFVTNGVLYTLDSKPTRLSDSSLTTLSEFLPVYLIDIVNCIPEDKDKPSDLRLQPCFYYLVPCFFLFDRVGILSYEKLCGGNTRHRTRARKRSLRNDRTRVPFGRYIATEHPFRSVATQRPNACSARSLRNDRTPWLHSDRAWLHSDRASVPLGRYVATELEPSPVAT